MKHRRQATPEAPPETQSGAPRAFANGKKPRLARAQSHTIAQHMKFSPLEWELLGKITEQMFQPNRTACLRALVKQEAQRRGLLGEPA